MLRKYKLALIGAGNMGCAILDGVLSSDVASSSEVIVSAHSTATEEKIKNKYNCDVVLKNAWAVQDAEIIILAVKPYQMAEVLSDIRESISADQIIISLAAGKTIQQIEEGLMSIEVAGRLKVVRAMPNTPAKVGESMSALCVNSRMTDTDIDRVMRVFGAFGRAEIINENMMDVVTGVSGSSPAFIYMLMEAMADAAVCEGMQRDLAYEFVSQTVLGAAKMLRDTGTHPGELKDAVTSPGGTTIAGVVALEEKGFRNAIISAVRESIEKARGL